MFLFIQKHLLELHLYFPLSEETLDMISCRYLCFMIPEQSPFYISFYKCICNLMFEVSVFVKLAHLVMISSFDVSERLQLRCRVTSESKLHRQRDLQEE